MLITVGLLLSIVTAVVIAQGHLFAGGVLVLFASIFDMFDGALARVRNAATIFGAFFDSTLDRYSESIILLGLLYYALQRPGIQDPYRPASREQSWMIALIFIAVVGSLMLSYTKARAEGLGIECEVGLLARPKRVILLAIGLLSGTGTWALVLLAVFSQATALERVISVWRTIGQIAITGERLSSNQHIAGVIDHYLPTGAGMNETRDFTVRPAPTSSFAVQWWRALQVTITAQTAAISDRVIYVSAV